MMATTILSLSVSLVSFYEVFLSLPFCMSSICSKLCLFLCKCVSIYVGSCPRFRPQLHTLTLLMLILQSLEPCQCSMCISTITMLIRKHFLFFHDINISSHSPNKAIDSIFFEFFFVFCKVFEGTFEVGQVPILVFQK